MPKGGSSKGGSGGGTKSSDKNYRDSESGQYTTKKYADQHPKTTEAERKPKK